MATTTCIYNTVWDGIGICSKLNHVIKQTQRVSCMGGDKCTCIDCESDKVELMEGLSTDNGGSIGSLKIARSVQYFSYLKQ